MYRGQMHAPGERNVLGIYRPKEPQSKPIAKTKSVCLNKGGKTSKTKGTIKADNRKGGFDDKASGNSREVRGVLGKT